MAIRSNKPTEPSDEQKRIQECKDRHEETKRAKHDRTYWKLNKETQANDIPLDDDAPPGTKYVKDGKTYYS